MEDWKYIEAIYRQRASAGLISLRATIRGNVDDEEERRGNERKANVDRVDGGKSGEVCVN